MKKHDRYQLKKNFRFYCLVLREEDDAFIYVGKTTAARMSGVFSHHINGKNAATDWYFDKENRPQMHILSEHILTTAEAYKFVVAYIYLFQKAGYVCINHTGTLAHAEQPKEETIAIIQSLENEPVDILLARTYVEKPAAADRKPTDKPAEKEPLIQMNIRIKPSDKQIFDQFRAGHRLNQQEAFSLLLDHTSNRHYADLLKKKDNKIQLLEQENERLQQKLIQHKETAVTKAEQRAREFLGFAKKGLNLYESLLPLPENAHPLPRHSYRHFTRKMLKGPDYEYPQTEGFTVMILETVLWSNRTKACFLLGTDCEGTRIKLRYYPKEAHLICSFLDSAHAYSGTAWLVGYQPAKDTAMELALAIPLCSILKELPEEANQKTDLHKAERKLSLDTQIDLAAQQKGC